ncbi:MAG TPA: hypothetical protein VHM48_14760 [Candidatus Limnocylindrales bacterium]|nr:hypothetical protein [Candidatus Limnocylindrales bacterium]
MDHDTAGRPDDERDSADPARQDLNATEDAIRADIQRLAAVEDEKSALDAEDPDVDALSNEAVELAGRIHRETRAERQLSDEIG